MGKFEIPTFQRDFVWEKKDKIVLFDSISKEYPIGLIFLCQLYDKFQDKGEIGPYEIDNSNNKDYLMYEMGFQKAIYSFWMFNNKMNI